MSELDSRVYVQMNDLLSLRQKMEKNKLLSTTPLRNLMTGQFQSRVKGRGLVFDEIRDYHLGDDVRYMDWRNTLRIGRPQVRSFTEEKERPVLIMVDQSQSMFFGSRNKMKSVVACEVAALITWIAMKQKDRIGGVTFHENSYKSFTPSNSKKKSFHFLTILKEFNHKLKNMESEPLENRFAHFLPKISNLATQNSLIILISDFYKIDDESMKIIGAMSKKNDVVAVHIYDELEHELDGSMDMFLKDFYGTVHLSEKTNKGLYKKYNEFKKNRKEELRKKVQSVGVKTISINTSEELIDQLTRNIGMN